MIQLILVIAGIYLLYLLIRYVIIPISGIALAITAGLGVLYALFISLKGFILSFKEHVNPYLTYKDNSKNAVIGIKRNYFFGPGYHQVISTVVGTFKNIKDELDHLTEIRENKTGNAWYLDMWVWIFYVIAFGCISVLGFIWAAVFSIILSVVTFIGMCLFYIFFSLLWLSDRITLLIKSINSRCGNCKKISVVPVFLCPTPGCGFKHRRLTPGPYGVFYRKCDCKARIPATIYNGRSKLQAFCPYCDVELANSGARHFGVQLVGGTSAGKTTFLAALWHIYPNLLKPEVGVKYEKFPENAFKELETWYQRGLSSSTSDTNAAMYSIIRKHNKETPYQLTVYDIAGEAFNNLGNSRQQLQFEYCECIIFVIDPTAPVKSVKETFSNFIEEFKRLKGLHSNKKSNIPIAVIISKADLYEKELGLNRSKTNQSEACAEFLQKNGFASIYNLIDCEFIEPRYFPVSAMGHKPVLEQPYKPWGVEEVARWIKTHSDNFLNRKKTIKV